MISFIIFIFYAIILLSGCIISNSKTQSFDPTQYTLYFKTYDFPLNNAKHWNWLTSLDGISTKACTKLFSNLCIYINETQSGFIIEYKNEKYDFLTDNDFSQIDISYPQNTIISSTNHRQLIDNSYSFNNPGGLPFGTGGMGGMGDMERLGMMPGFGGSLGGMMPGVGQLGGMLNPNMGIMPSMGGGMGFGLGGNGGNPYPGYMMGYANPMRRLKNMYTMFSRVLGGKPIWKPTKRRGGTRYGAPIAGRRRGRRGRRGRRRRRRRRRKRRGKKNYMHDGGKFGKMGFPSLSGNMMGLVQSSQKMPKFMQVPPTIHINADFRRLLGNMNMNTNTNMDGILLTKCVIVSKKNEICGIYNFKYKFISLRYIIGDRYEINMNMNMNMNMNNVKDDIRINNNDYNLIQLHMINQWYGIWRNWLMFDEESELSDNDLDDEEYSFKTVIWSNIKKEMKQCNDLLLSFINYTICVMEDENKDFVIYFENTNDGYDETYGDNTKMIRLIYKESKLLISNEMNWNEIYTYDNSKKKLCTFMPIIKLCATININDMKISEISVQFVSIV